MNPLSLPVLSIFISAGLFSVTQVENKVERSPLCGCVEIQEAATDELKKHKQGGPGSSVSIAIGYGLDGPGIESRWGRDFLHLSTPVLGPTQPPVQWVSGLSRG
jgi:hypothetical protein